MCGCSSIGTQPPQWHSGMFSPDGKYYVYTWEEFFVNQYSQRGGATFRAGSTTTYLQVMDCKSGKKILDKPIKSPEILTIVDIENNHVWLQSYEISKSWSPALFDLNTMKMAFSAKDLAAINPSVPMKMGVIRFFKNSPGKSGGFFEATDGRQYIIDPQTGKYQESAPSKQSIETKDQKCYQTNSSLKGFNLSTGTRKKISNKFQESSDDFISPKFLNLQKENENMRDSVTLYQNNFFVLSPSFTTDDKDMLLTCINKDSLNTIWSVALPQNENEDHSYDKERFFLQDKFLMVANTSGLIVIDLPKGSIHALYPFFDINKKE
ncbi:MAG: hypothetical protein JSS67_04335 [Bacteroidetes bacterium]|nr:hypothetical protein [Bacteroidota bacterium]